MKRLRPKGTPVDSGQVPAIRTPALNALFLLIIANFALQPLTEPDFGWHLRTGLDLLMQGGRLPALDPYSHTMPDWPWVEHAWLTDLVLGWLYASGGEVGGLLVIAFFGLVTGAAWIIAARTGQAIRPIRLVTCALSLWVALPFLGARTQVVTLLGVAVVLLLLDRLRQGARWIIWIFPPLFLLWANLHGGFTAGLFLLTVVVGLNWCIAMVSRVWPDLFRRFDEVYLPSADLRGLALATGFAGLVTLLNPYGWRLHQEILDSLVNQFMVSTLQEWQPPSLETLAGRLFGIYLGGLTIAAVLWYRRLEPVRIGVLLAFLFVACRHLRNIPLFLIVSLPFAVELLQMGCDRMVLALKLRQRTFAQWAMGVTGALACLLVFLGSDHVRAVWRFGTNPDVAFRQTSYPIEAVEWIRAHRDRLGSRPVHDYQYGGFLLWQLPGLKTFIDGRMPAWQIEDRWIFKDYVDLVPAAVPRTALLNKYAIDWALLKRGTAFAAVLATTPGWSHEYEDMKVVIYVRGSSSAAGTIRESAP
ncbi:MAG: hypothetical protein HOP35_10115 [Nitrospira sp.]|nr:hypothetical protein [Nitrospira sp.]